MENDSPPRYPSAPPLLPPGSAPAPKRRGSPWIWVLAAVVLIIGAVLYAAGNMFSRLASVSHLAPHSGHQFEEVEIEGKGSPHKIVVIEVEGVISGGSWDRSGRSMVDSIQEQLKAAGRDEAVRAVILKVDSPGGEVLASDDISRAILDFQEKKKKPVVAVMGSMAASGGYYVSAPCQWIVANELTITGSIGVIMHSFNYRGLLDKVGLVPEVFKSGKFKDMLSGTKRAEEVDPKEREMIQSMIDETYGKFKRVVAEGRKRASTLNKGEGKSLSANWEDLADGRILTGNQAVRDGFVDELGTMETGLERARKIAGIANADVIKYVEPFDFSHLLRMFGQSKAAGLRVDLGVDFPRLQAGRLYFLCPTVTH